MARLRRLVGGARWAIVSAAVGVLVLVAVLLAVIVLVPPLAIDPHGLTRDQWLTHVQDLRTTILQGLGGLAVLFGAVVAALNLRETGRQNRAVLEVELKTDMSRRNLALPLVVVEALRIQRERQEMQRALMGASWQDSGYVFTTGTGRPLDGSNVTNDFQEVLRKKGLPRMRSTTCATAARPSCWPRASTRGWSWRRWVTARSR